ncbi:casparian strip membrane protein 1-like [Andrographis paniculata]|uniref:casparian strip membrane protein 1-like n=1 Tax=Andrographis paniculata TaxID=175694 RepID=UPI0021E7EEE0|nr:casparian strip membrane protein 1-like [Andrographis paniculata]
MEKGEATTIEVAESRREQKGKAPLLGGAYSRAAAAATGRKRGVAVFDLIVRICAAAAALGATIAMGTADETLPFFTPFFQFEASYDDMSAFSFFVIAFAIVTGYLALSVPFSIFCIAKPAAAGPRLFLVFGDILILTGATSAAAAATAIVYLAHNGNSATNWLAICQQYTDFCQTVSGAVIGSFIAVALLICLVLISAFALKKH